MMKSKVLFAVKQSWDDYQFGVDRLLPACLKFRKFLSYKILSFLLHLKFNWSMVKVKISLFKLLKEVGQHFKNNIVKSEFGKNFSPEIILLLL